MYTTLRAWSIAEFASTQMSLAEVDFVEVGRGLTLADVRAEVADTALDAEPAGAPLDVDPPLWVDPVLGLAPLLGGPAGRQQEDHRGAHAESSAHARTVTPRGPGGAASQG